MIVRIKALDRSNWSGFIRYKNTKDYIVPIFDSMGSIMTGLTKEDEERIGSALNKDLKPSSPFWYEYNIIMMDKERVFNTDNPEHELAYKVLLAHKRVANSETERAQGKWPAADYIIYNEETEALVKNKKFTVERKAGKLFDDLSVDQMRDLLKLYPGFANSNSVSASIVETKLYEFMKTDPEKFIGLAQDKNLDMKVFLKDLVQAKILRKNRTAYYYGTDALGHDDESTITYLEDPTNNGLLIALKQELEKGK